MCIGYIFLTYCLQQYLILYSKVPFNEVKRFDPKHTRPENVPLATDTMTSAAAVYTADLVTGEAENLI